MYAARKIGDFGVEIQQRGSTWGNQRRIQRLNCQMKLGAGVGNALIEAVQSPRPQADHIAGVNLLTQLADEPLSTFGQ